MKNKTFAALIAKLLNCNDLFRMFEDKLPPEVNKKKEINEDYCKRCKAWYRCIYENLDLYAEFQDEQSKYKTFINILLYKIAVEKDNKIYKLLLYTFHHKFLGV